jgi:ubiquinone/menaquinone biosynthesis C-methylase UbiE
MMDYKAQVSEDHYKVGSYATQDRWDSYWHHISMVRSKNPQKVLEVGIGGGVVTRELRSSGIEVTTLDIAEDLNPDLIGSVTKIPLTDKIADLTLAAEVLEHIKFEDVPKALNELVRVTKKHVLISIPHPGYVFSINFKVPLLPRIVLFTKIPFFWQFHNFDGQHYWELGKRGYSYHKFIELTKDAGLRLEQNKCYADDPAHRHFLFSV